MLPLCSDWFVTVLPFLLFSKAQFYTDCSNKLADFTTGTKQIFYNYKTDKLFRTIGINSEIRPVLHLELHCLDAGR